MQLYIGSRKSNWCVIPVSVFKLDLVGDAWCIAKYMYSSKLDIVLHDVAMHCIVKHFIALRCVVLHCIVLYRIVLFLGCIVLHLHCTALYCIVLHYITLHYTVLCHIRTISFPPPEADRPSMSSPLALSRALCKSASRSVAVIFFPRECVGITAAVDDKPSASKENCGIGIPCVIPPFLSELPAMAEEERKTHCVTVTFLG